MTSDFRITSTAPDDAITITPVGKAELNSVLESLPSDQAAWARATEFSAEAGQSCLLPAASGAVGQVLLGVNQETTPSPWDWAGLPSSLPGGCYRIDPEPDAALAQAAVHGWALGTYTFDRYRTRPTIREASLVWPEQCNRAHAKRAAAAVFLARDLINTPASHMGPGELTDTVLAVASRYGARTTVFVGDELHAAGYPAVHAVGRASIRPPRFVDLVWGEADRPRVTLCGKGVCFDSGGLDLKPASAMKLMKKDMGGAAITLALAQMIMDAGLPVRLRLLIPAVENSVSGDAMRPLDVIPTRKGSSVEIGNTDAEGRLILADALYEASSEHPDMLLDCATLTGAARVALGTEIPALFCNDDPLAQSLLEAAQASGDPLWRLPLWAPYKRHLKGKTADLTNAPDLPFAGAILAALFLAEFVDPVCPWAHIDVMAWNTEKQPGRPVGGEAMGLLALYQTIASRFG